MKITARHPNVFDTVLNCQEGRSIDRRVNLDFYGHRLVLHITDNVGEENSNPVDGHDGPFPHIGMVLTMDIWNELADHFKSYQVKFIIEPY